MTELDAKLGTIVLVAVIAVAMVYTLFARKRRKAPPPEPTDGRDYVQSYVQSYVPGSAADPARDVFTAASGGEPPTEDQIARARAGGVRGAPQLGQAPLPRQAREQLPGKIDDGHVA
jgi:hypothetical protein